MGDGAMRVRIVMLVLLNRLCLAGPIEQTLLAAHWPLSRRLIIRPERFFLTPNSKKFHCDNNTLCSLSDLAILLSHYRLTIHL